MVKVINNTIRILILSDFLLQSGWGLLGPIFAIFLTKQIQGGSIALVGFVAATYWLSKSIVQPFFAYIFDVKKGEKDDFKFLVIGLTVANLIPLGYVFSTYPWQIFILEFLRGIAMACVVPTWSAIFTRHIDKGWEAFSWSIESTGVGFAYAFAGALGGVLATFFGFKVVFVLVTVLGLTSTLFLCRIRHRLFARDGFVPKLPPMEKPF